MPQWLHRTECSVSVGLFCFIEQQKWRMMPFYYWVSLIRVKYFPRHPDKVQVHAETLTYTSYYKCISSVLLIAAYITLKCLSVLVMLWRGLYFIKQSSRLWPCDCWLCIPKIIQKPTSSFTSAESSWLHQTGKSENGSLIGSNCNAGTRGGEKTLE